MNSSNQQHEQKWLASAIRDEEIAVEAAIDAIAKARRELDEMEKQIRSGHEQGVWRRPNSIYGVDANAIFGAVGAIERSAEMRKIFGQES